MYNIQQLQVPMLDKYWSSVSPLLEQGLFYCEGELNIDQLRLLIVQGKVAVFIGLNDYDTIVGAIALEVNAYPNFRAANIISYGGEQLFATQDDFNLLKSRLKQFGVSFLQGWCKPAQARLFKKSFGFDTPYEMIRVSLGD